LITLLGHVAVDGLDQPQFVGEVQECGYGAELGFRGFEGLSVRVAKSPQKVLRLAQVLDGDRSRFPADPTRLDDVPVRVSVGIFLVQGGHLFVYTTRVKVPTWMP
jgi:hypothetical protein